MRALVPDPGRIDKSFFRETLAGGSIHSRRGLLFRHIIPAPRGQASGLLRFARTSGIPPPTRRIAPAGQPLLSGPQCVRTYSSSSAIANNFTVVRIGIQGDSAAQNPAQLAVGIGALSSTNLRPLFLSEFIGRRPTPQQLPHCRGGSDLCTASICSCQLSSSRTKTRQGRR